MKSFGIGMAAAIVAAYAMGEEPTNGADLASEPTFTLGTLMTRDRDTLSHAERTSRGLPPFWGQSGIVRYRE